MLGTKRAKEHISLCGVTSQSCEMLLHKGVDWEQHRRRAEMSSLYTCWRCCCVVDYIVAATPGLSFHLVVFCNTVFIADEMLCTWTFTWFKLLSDQRKHPLSTFLNHLEKIQLLHLNGRPTGRDLPLRGWDTLSKPSEMNAIIDRYKD